MGGFCGGLFFWRKRAEGGVAEGGVAEGGVAEGDAADRGAAKGLRGTALRSAGTNARETQNPGHRLDSRRNSEELSPLRSPEIVFWRTRFLLLFGPART